MNAPEHREVHNFRDKLREGEAFEDHLDGHFARWFRIAKVGAAQQKAGLDRIFVDKQGRKITVQYKADSKTQESNNAFVETASVSVLGWAYTCQAELLLYYCVGLEKVFVIRPERLRTFLDAWKRKYRMREAQNDGYITLGIAVPLPIFEKCCEKIVDLRPTQADAPSNAVECTVDEWIAGYEREEAKEKKVLGGDEGG